MSCGFIEGSINSKTEFSQPPIPVMMVFTYKGCNHGLNGSVDSLREICLRVVAGRDGNSSLRLGLESHLSRINKDSRLDLDS